MDGVSVGEGVLVGGAVGVRVSDGVGVGAPTICARTNHPITARKATAVNTPAINPPQGI
jgi:hypothetical protein